MGYLSDLHIQIKWQRWSSLFYFEASWKKTFIAVCAQIWCFPRESLRCLIYLVLISLKFLLSVQFLFIVQYVTVTMQDLWKVAFLKINSAIKSLEFLRSSIILRSEREREGEREKQSNSELKFHQILGKSRIGTLLPTFIKTYKNNQILIFFIFLNFSKTCLEFINKICIFLILNWDMYQL